MAPRGRTCIACRRVRPKADLMRIVRRPDGTVAVDAAGREQGRGAYVCRDEACAAGARRSLGKALRAATVEREVERRLLEAVKA